MVSVRPSVHPSADLGFKISTDGQDQVLKSRSLDGRGGRRQWMAAATILCRCDQRSLRAYWWWIVRAVSGHCPGQHGPFFFLFCFVLFSVSVCPSGQFLGTARASTNFFFFFLGVFFSVSVKLFSSAKGGGGRMAGVA